MDGRLARRRRTGVTTYIRELRAALEAASAEDLRVEWLCGPPGLPQRGRLTSLGNLALDLAWLHLWVPLTAWRRRASAVHAPVNWAPWWSPCPTVVTMHDLSWERRPEDYPNGFRQYARLFGRRSAQRARLVIAPSATTAHDVSELYGVPAARVRAIPHGVHPDPAPPAQREPFVLCVGVLDPRKRVLALVEGHRRYWDRAPGEPPRCRLVVAGAGGGDEDAVRRAAGPGVDLRGFVGAEELVELYRRATLLVFPSAYEGFGLPVVEAMSHGCPAMVARNSALVEVAGESALYLDDASPHGIATALGEALADRPALAAMGERARLEAARFSWPVAARATLDAYRTAIGRQRP